MVSSTVILFSFVIFTSPVFSSLDSDLQISFLPEDKVMMRGKQKRKILRNISHTLRGGVQEVIEYTEHQFALKRSVGILIVKQIRAYIMV